MCRLYSGLRRRFSAVSPCGRFAVRWRKNICRGNKGECKSSAGFTGCYRKGGAAKDRELRFFLCSGRGICLRFLTRPSSEGEGELRQGKEAPMWKKMLRQLRERRKASFPKYLPEIMPTLVSLVCSTSRSKVMFPS